MKKILIVIFAILLPCIGAQAGELNTEDDTYLENAIDGVEEYDFSDIQQFLDENVDSKNIDFLNTAKRFITGESTSVITELFSDIKDKLLVEIDFNKGSIGKIIIIAIVSAFFTNFSMIFSGNNISETGFYITYMLLITVLVSAFGVITSVAANVISMLLDFMKALVPTYFMAIGMTSGTVTAAAFYEIVLVMITGVNWLFLKVIIPAINIYVVLMLVNSISKDDFLSRFAELIETIVKWLSKSAMAAVLGVNIIQGMVLPSIDAMKNTTLGKVVSIIPGIGNSANAVTEILLGSGRIIKNGIGVAALVVIIVMCLVPIIKLAVFTLMYQGTSALLQPITDKRILDCVSAVTTGTKLLLSSVVTATALFIITIAIVCVSTNIST